MLSVIAKYFSSVTNILKVVKFVLNKNIKYTSVYSDFPCFSFRGAVHFPLLLWQYEDHYSESLKIPQITGYFHCIESTFQEIAEKKSRSRYLFLDGCALRRELDFCFPYFLTLFIPETSDRDLACVLFRWCEAEGGAEGGVGLASPRTEAWVWNSCGLGERRVSRVADTCLAWDTCIEGSLWPETRAIKMSENVRRWFICNSYLYWFIDYLSSCNDCWKRNCVEMTEHLEIKVTLKTCLPVVLSVLGDLLRDELSGHN